MGDRQRERCRSRTAPPSPVPGGSAPKVSPKPSTEPRRAAPTGDGDAGEDLSDLEEADEGRVRRALEEARWRREKAAEILGVSPRTLYRWIKKLGI